MSTERLIVDEALADDFVTKLAVKASSLLAGDPREPVVLGSMIDLSAAERMDELIADAIAKGAVLVCGGRRSGTIVEATLIDRVTPAMRLYQEESFGPVKPIVRVAVSMRRSGSPTTPNTDYPPRCSARIFSAPWPTPKEFNPASAISTARLLPMKRKCHSAA